MGWSLFVSLQVASTTPHVVKTLILLLHNRRILGSIRRSDFQKAQVPANGFRHSVADPQGDSFNCSLGGWLKRLFLFFLLRSTFGFDFAKPTGNRSCAFLACCTIAFGHARHRLRVTERPYSAFPLAHLAVLRRLLLAIKASQHY